MTAAAKDISKHLARLDSRIEDLEEAGVPTQTASRVALESQRAAFVECQDLLDRSKKAAEKNDTFKSTAGNITIQDDAVYFDGMATEQQYRTMDLTFGDANVAGAATAIRGMADSDLVRSIIEMTTSRSAGGRSGSQPNATPRHASESNVQGADITNAASFGTATPLAISNNSLSGDMWQAVLNEAAPTRLYA